MSVSLCGSAQGLSAFSLRQAFLPCIVLFFPSIVFLHPFLELFPLFPSHCPPSVSCRQTCVCVCVCVCVCAARARSHMYMHAQTHTRFLLQTCIHAHTATFGHFSAAFFTMFQCVTGDGWARFPLLHTDRQHHAPTLIDIL